MSPRTALLAGLLLGVTVMIGVLGAIAWKAHAFEGETAPTTTVDPAHPAPGPSGTPTPPAPSDAPR